MEPIATYSEVRFDGRRTFELFADKVIVRGKQSLESDYESEISLAALVPNVDRMRYRSPWFMSGFWMMVVSFVTCSVLLTGLKMSFADMAPGLVLMLGIAGFMLSVATCRKIEYCIFKNQTGVGVLSIARAGKQAVQFDSFVNALTKQIRVTNGASAP